MSHCMNGNIAGVDVILAAGASVNAPGSCRAGRYTPLSAGFRSDRMRTRLLAAGADVNVGHTMHYAADLGPANALAALIDHGGDANLGAHEHRAPVFMCLQHGNDLCLEVLLQQPELDLTVTGISGHTPLEYAIVVRNEDATTMIRYEVGHKLMCVCVHVC